MLNRHLHGQKLSRHNNN